MHVNALNVNNLNVCMKVSLGGVNMLIANNSGYNFTPQKRYDLFSNTLSQSKLY
jgi:hypothetical protein